MQSDAVIYNTVRQTGSISRVKEQHTRMANRRVLHVQGLNFHLRDENDWSYHIQSPRVYWCHHR